MNNRNAVVLCTDRNMIVPAAFVATAIRGYASREMRNYDLIIVTDEGVVSGPEAAWLVHRGIEHRVVDFAELREVFDRSGRLTTATLIKLTLPDVFAARYDRILYLDADLTIHADVTVLFALDLGNLPLAANRRGVIFLSDEQRNAAEAHFTELGMSRPFRYFNSGVMLIDVANWRREDLTRITLNFISKNRDLCLLPDEDGLNAVLDGRFASLSPIWNMAPRRQPFMPIHRQQSSAVIHYSGHDKPWMRFGRDKPLLPDMQAYRLYQSFLPGSPWPRWLGAQWTVIDLYEGIVSAIRRGLGREGITAQREETEYAERFHEYVASADFIDIEQGITQRLGHTLKISAE